MINKGGILGDIAGEMLEQGQAATKQVGKQIVNAPSDLAKTAGSQITGGSDQPAQAPNEPSTIQQNADQTKQTQDVVKSLYGVGDKNTNQSSSQQSQQNQIRKITEEHPEKTPEELQKLQKLRQELHQTTYYQPLTNPPKPPEERQGEKIQKEEEEKKKMEELQIKEEKKKEPPVAVQRAKNKTEMFRGASG
ncbi:MAG: hypothetical protein M1524_01300 [Patescibacteria group bacterium]|nr:hypothetical protein [Patescibacteria group bacterium]